MTATCKIHNTEMTLVPAGISKKTQKPYNAFYGCRDFDCKETAPAPDEDPEQEMYKFTKDLDVENKHETLNQLDEVAKKETEEKEEGDYTQTEVVPKSHEEKMWRAKEEREKRVFELKQKRDLRSHLATAALRELIIHTAGKIDHKKTMDDLFNWIWTGEWTE